MASIASDGKGFRRLLFVDPTGKRVAVRLGKISPNHAESLRVHVENLISAAIQGQPPSDHTTRWVAGLDDVLHKKLARVGLVTSRESARLGLFLDGYIDGREADTKPSTQMTYRQVKGRLVRHFGEDKPLREITPGDADGWRLAMLKQGLGENTVRKASAIAKLFFKAALRRKLIPENPFIDLVGTVRGDKDRFYFVTPAEIGKVMEVTHDHEWRLILALVRWGGLRCPSEVLALTWGDIDWANDRFTVHSSKTEHHEGHGSRSVPIYPELRPYLLESLERAADGATYCVTRYRDNRQNMRTQLNRLIRRAGLEPWEKPLQNLRASRQTELAATYPIHLVCAWMGNSALVAQEHYLRATDADFRKAASECAQNRAQKSEEVAGKDVNGHPADRGESDVTSGGFRSNPIYSPNASTKKRSPEDSNLKPLAPEANALSN